MVKRIGSIVALCCVVCADATRAGEPAQTVTMAAGARYGAGWLRSFFLGAHWRDAWETPADQVISNAVRCLPQPVYEKEGADLENALPTAGAMRYPRSRASTNVSSPIGWTCAAPGRTRTSGSSAK